MAIPTTVVSEQESNSRSGRCSSRQRSLAVQMGRYWGRFARAGNPNGDGLPAWPRWSKDSGQVQSLRPGGSVPLATGTFRTQHQCEYWDGLLGAVGGGT
jgi:para-nitrobenzyl esterase